MKIDCPHETVPQTASLYFCLLHHVCCAQEESDMPQDTAILFNGALPQQEVQCTDAQVSVRFMVLETEEGYAYRAWVQRVGTTDSASPMEFILKKEVLYTYYESFDDAEESWQFLISENTIQESNIL